MNFFGNKVGIMTIRGKNCGNRLQNYALQTILKGLGYRVETIRRQKDSYVRELLRYWVKPLWENDRYSRFFEFDRHIRWSRCIVSPEYTTENLAEHFDLFVIGSDQIWNPDYISAAHLEYLPMVPPQKKCSYAASFGISSIPEELQAHTAGLLNTIPRITLREDSGAKIVRELTGREAAVVLDPTLLLTREQWERVMKKPKNLPNEPYAFVYLLGESDPEAKTETICREQNLRKVDFLDDDMMAGPAEFLYLIRHAQLIFTDSYHASVFAFLLRRPVVIFERQSQEGDMSSRLDTLCRLFHMSHHRIGSNSFCLEDVMLDTYDTGHEVLSLERKRCLDLLKGILQTSTDREGAGI